MLPKPLVRVFKWMRYPVGGLFLLFFGPLLTLLSCSVNLSGNWYDADRGTSEQAPNPRDTPEAIVQIYAARAYNWRGLFAVHMWIATKPEKASHYRTHQVIGWRAYRGGSAVVSGFDTPDRYWFGNKPEKLLDIRGEKAVKLIPQIETAVQRYPHAYDYQVYPGPNSNTFIAHVAREVPDLKFHLPPHAVGKDYIPDGGIFAATPSGTGYQLSLWGLFGISLAEAEGLEVNLLGLTFGVDPLGPALKLPGIGRVGWDHHDLGELFSSE